jgi:Electron transfer DM13
MSGIGASLIGRRASKKRAPTGPNKEDGKMGIRSYINYLLISLIIGVAFLACASNKKMDNMEDQKQSGMMDTKQSSMMDQKQSGMMDKRQSGMAETKMQGAMTGMLMGTAGYHAAGKAMLSKDTMGKATLTLSDIKVDRIPDGQVYLAKDGDYAHGVHLGMLKQFSGSVSFALPPGTDTGMYNSVVIWCKKFNVEIGRAELANGMMQ